MNKPPYQFIFYQSLDSTNSEVRRLHQLGATEGIVVVAELQTAGRGRLGRQWISPAGNLYFSILLQPKVSIDVLSQLSLVAGIALAKTLQCYVNDKSIIGLKWPNDLLINNKKVAGILVETDPDVGRGQGSICYLGIGINVRSAPDFADYPTASLKEFLEVMQTNEELLNTYIKNFIPLYELWQVDGFSVLKNDWLKFAHGIGKIVNASRGGKICGRFDTITDQGCLVLIDEDGKQHLITSSEVTF